MTLDTLSASLLAAGWDYRNDCWTSPRQEGRKFKDFQAQICVGRLTEDNFAEAVPTLTAAAKLLLRALTTP